MRISDWSSDVCSSDLRRGEQGAAGSRPDARPSGPPPRRGSVFQAGITKHRCHDGISRQPPRCQQLCRGADVRSGRIADVQALAMGQSTPPLFSFIIADADRSEEHTSELQSIMRISYAVFCLKKKKTIK